MLTASHGILNQYQLRRPIAWKAHIITAGNKSCHVLDSMAHVKHESADPNPQDQNSRRNNIASDKTCKSESVPLLVSWKSTCRLILKEGPSGPEATLSAQKTVAASNQEHRSSSERFTCILVNYCCVTIAQHLDPESSTIPSCLVLSQKFCRLYTDFKFRGLVK